MSEKDIIGLFQRKFGRAYIYADEYKKLLSLLGFGSYMDLRSFCKEQGDTDIRAWLIRYDMYRNIEKDMRYGSYSFDAEQQIDAVASQILEEYPLIGEAVLSDETMKQLFARAQQVFDEILEYGDKDLTESERDVMLLAIIQHLKRRSIQETDKAEGQIWSYIYNQFGLNNALEQENTRQRVYTALCRIIRGSLLQHNRFFSEEENTQRYYNTLNLHSMTPVKSMESLFEILLSFYIHDLKFNYVQGDPAFSAIVKSIVYRWDRDIEIQEDLNIRSNPITSGLRTLFTSRPCFMRDYCEQIVRSIDALVRSNDAAIQRQSALQLLLCGWYARKDGFVRSDLQRSRQSAGSTGRTATSVESLRIRYILENERVYLMIPSIRLEEKSDNYPIIRIYQQGACIVSRSMEVYGRYSWTTHPMRIALEDMDVDFDAPLEFAVQIEYQTDSEVKTIVDTESKLHRQYILFDQNGQETTAQNSLKGMYYIFANEKAVIEADDTNINWLDHAGQLTRLYIDDASGICVNGEELAVSPDRKDSIRFYSSVSCAEHLCAVDEGYDVTVYSESFALTVKIPENKNSLSYRIEIDGKMEPMARYCPAGKHIFILNPPAVPVKIHLIRIIDFETGRIAGLLRYVILPGVTVKTNRSIIYGDGKPVRVYVNYDGCSIQATDLPEANSNIITVSPEHLSFDLKVEIPLIYGELNGQSLFDLDAIIWKEKIPDTSFIRLHHPEGWQCCLRLGNKNIPQSAVDGSFEIGNAVRTHGLDQDSELLVLVVRTPNGDQDLQVLSRIAFREYFTESPVSVENDMPMWKPVQKYIGNEKDEFILDIDVPFDNSPYTYVLGLKDAVIDKLLFEDFPYGEFPYRVKKRSKGLFSANKEQLLYEGKLTIGEPEQWALDGKALYLDRARCWDMNTNRLVNIDLPKSAGCLIDFKYIGYSVPAGEEVPYPEYEATLYFYDQRGERWLPFNSTDRDDYECINPVHIWIVSPKLLMLTTVYEEAVMLDRKYNSIVNRTLSREEERVRVILPDYFEYSEE